MPCKSCGQNSWVTIGSKKYCTNCGSLQSAGSIVGGVAAIDGPAEAKPKLPPRQTVSAQSLHNNPALASGGVLDLRTPKPQPAESKPQATFTDVAVAPKPVVVTPPAPAPVPPPEAIPAPKPQPTLKEMATQLSSPAEIEKKSVNRKALAKPASIAAASLAVVIMGGYIWMNNYSNLSIRTASSRAGIVASLPQYAPSGYKVNGPIQYGTGFVSFNLKNKTDKSIAVIQRKSDWNSASLLELYVSPKTKDYVAVTTQGLKIYLYGDGQATWVNRGLQYVVQADSSIGREQLVKIAESL